VIIHNTPQDSYQAMNADQGIYAQDSWTIGRFTVNPGVRFEHFTRGRDKGIDLRYAPGRGTTAPTIAVLMSDAARPSSARTSSSARCTMSRSHR